MFWITFVFFSLLFLFVLWAFGVRIYRGTGVKISTATAGDPHMVVSRTQRIVNLNPNGFYGHDRRRIDYDSYEKFWAAGWSMLLVGIQDGDLLFVKPYTDSNAMHFPCVVVLQREHFSPFDWNTASYKVRRSWAICHMEDDNIENILNKIIASEDFQQIIHKNKDKNCFLSPEEMKKDFFKTRMAKYLQDYPSCKQKNNENNTAIISTTLDTKRNIVHFSIHPYRSVIGEVKYSFGMQEAA